MDAARDIAASLPAIDLVAGGVLLLGLLWGLLRGLAPLFATLLWVLLALWLGTTLAPVLLEQMPNTEPADAAAARLDAFGVVAGVVLLLPLLARALGSGGGETKKAKERGASQRVFGAVAGLAAAALMCPLILPFALRLPTLAAGADAARAPAVAEGLAGSLALIYPSEVGASLRGELAASGGEPGASEQR